ncbi:uncharacterized protein LOC123208736 [Mangifera indica]|uniref:uncharacterized protein LOC123208736 n=1 Tax=Mangifera indica TaxID=29780 RepID=UPI001CF99180|nr:uncharacterized protein LOC123208736 [Mangifera indica]
MRDFEGHENDFLINTPAEILALQLDLLLLENQLSYILLEGLYNLVTGSPSFIDLGFKFFRVQMFSQRAPKQKEFKHFTDLQRATLVENFPAEEYTKNYTVDISELHCATKLQESGVKFRCASGEGRLLVIRFEQGELRIPQLSVFHETDTMLQNIMALEQCRYPRYSLVVCAYVRLLDSLIEDKRDAQLLVD